jgi:hypothetical protein
MLVRRALALCFVASITLGAVPLAHADSPSPITSWVEAVIIGSVGGDPASDLFEYRTRMLDLNHNPQVGQLVWLDFSGTPIQVFSVQNSGTTLNCDARQLSKLTDAQGYANFAPRFGGSIHAHAVQVFHEGVLLALVPARSVDIDALDGRVGLHDFALFSAAFASVSPHPEANFDLSHNDVPDLADFQIFAQHFAKTAQGTYCP